jgi:AraC-like DNA-binding protein
MASLNPTLPRSPDEPAPGGFRYLPVSEEMHAWECIVTTVGSTVYAPGERYPHPGHPTAYDFDWKTGRVLPEYLLILIAEGEGKYEVRKGETARCGRGDILQFTPGQWHRYQPAAASGWTELWVGMGGEYLHRLRKKGLAFTRPCVATGERYAAVHAAFAGVLQAVQPQATSNNPLLSSEAFKIVTLIAEASRDGSREAPRETAQHERLGEALAFIWSNSHRAIRVADVAAAAGLHPRSLERLFATAHKCSVRQEIEWSRFFLAQRLLRNTKLPIKEIAYACGFKDTRRMIEVFHRRGGQTPGDLRTGA